MKITARQPHEITAVAVSTKTRLPLPEPQALFALFPNLGEGAQYFDDPALGVRSFILPRAQIRITFERIRMRVEDTASRRVEDLALGETLGMLAESLYPKGTFDRFGFNYDVVYRYDDVIPSRDVMGAFIRAENLEEVSHFGWQFTLTKEKGKRRETYFCKVVSPLEIQILANVELDRAFPVRAELQKLFVSSYEEAQRVLETISFARV